MKHKSHCGVCVTCVCVRATNMEQQYFNPIPSLDMEELATGSNNNNEPAAVTNEFAEFLSAFNPFREQAHVRVSKSDHFPFTKGPLSELAHKILDKMVMLIAVEPSESERSRLSDNARSVYNAVLPLSEIKRLDSAMNVIMARSNWYFTWAKDVLNLSNHGIIELMKLSKNEYISRQGQVEFLNANAKRKAHQEGIEVRKAKRKAHKEKNSSTTTKPRKITSPKINKTSIETGEVTTVVHSSILSYIISKAPRRSDRGPVRTPEYSDEFPFTIDDPALSDLASKILDKIIDELAKYNEFTNISSVLNPAISELKLTLSKYESERVMIAIAKVQSRISELQMTLGAEYDAKEKEERIEILKFPEPFFRHYVNTHRQLPLQQFGLTPEQQQSFQLLQSPLPENNLFLLQDAIDQEGKRPSMRDLLFSMEEDESIDTLLQFSPFRTPLDTPNATITNELENDLSYQPVPVPSNGENDPYTRAISLLLSEEDLTTFIELIRGTLYGALMFGKNLENIWDFVGRLFRIYTVTRSDKVTEEQLSQDWNNRYGLDIKEYTNNASLDAICKEMSKDPLRFAKGMSLSDIDFIDEHTSSWLGNVEEIKEQLDSYIPSLKHMIRFKYEAVASLVTNILFKSALISETWFKFNIYMAVIIRCGNYSNDLSAILPAPIQDIKIFNIELTPLMLEEWGLDGIYDYLEPVCKSLNAIIYKVTRDDGTHVDITCTDPNQFYIILNHVLRSFAEDGKLHDFLAEEQDGMFIISHSRFTTGDNEFYSEETRKYFTIHKEELNPYDDMEPCVYFDNDKLNYCTRFNIREMINYMSSDPTEMKKWALKQFEAMLLMKPIQNVPDEALTMANLDSHSLAKLEDWYGNFADKIHLLLNHAKDLSPESFGFQFKSKIPKINGVPMDVILYQFFNGHVVAHSIYNELIDSPRKFAEKYGVSLQRAE